MSAEGLGFAPKPGTTFAVKALGRHRWMALATYVLSDEEARMAHEGVPVLLDQAHLGSFHIGCLDCEQEYGAAMTARCPAAAFPWNREDR